MGKGAGEIGDLSQHLAPCMHTYFACWFLDVKEGRAKPSSIGSCASRRSKREKERKNERAGERGEKIYNGCPQHDHVIGILWSVSNSVIMCNGIK